MEEERRASGTIFTVFSTASAVGKTLVGRTRPPFSSAVPPYEHAPSFPSGHTLHAVSFTVVALAYYPWLAPLLLPFTVGVALSRVVLGLHYPSDVLAATAIGSLLAAVSLWLVPGVSLFA